MDTNLDVLGIIKRAKQALDLKKDSELAGYLGVSRATVTNWGARNSIDFKLLLDKFGNKVDYNWLLLGKGNPVHQPRFCESELAQGEVDIIHNPKTPEPIDDRSVTLYDITAAANLKTLFTNKQQYALGKILIDPQYIRLRRRGICKRGQHVPYIEIGRHYRIQGNQQFRKRHLRGNIPGVVYD